MSSFARRSLRTTAAAAGIAALGVGIAGPALAAPGVPELPALDAFGAPAAATDVPGMAAFTDAADAFAALPDAFAFEAPAYDAPELDAPVDSMAIPADASSVPSTDGVVTMDGGQVQGAPSADPTSALSNAPALPSLDSASMFTDLAQKAMSGENVTSNNDLSH